MLKSLNAMHARAGAPAEPLSTATSQRGERDDHGDDDQRHRGAVAARHLRERVDRRRDGLRLAGNVGHESDGGAEFAERSGEGQHHAGDHAGQRQRQRDGEKQPDAVGAEVVAASSSRRSIASIDSLIARTISGNAMMPQASARAGPAEREYDAEMLVQEGANRRFARQT